MVKCNLQNGQPNPSWTSITRTYFHREVLSLPVQDDSAQLAVQLALGRWPEAQLLAKKLHLGGISLATSFSVRAKSGGGIVASARWYFFEGFDEKVRDVICSFFRTRNWKRLFLSKCAGSTHGTGNKNKVAKPDSESGAKDLNVETSKLRSEVHMKLWTSNCGWGGHSCCHS